MCGIFGLAKSQKSFLSTKDTNEIVKNLYLFSESRGKEASGIVIKKQDTITVLKEPKSASLLIRSKKYKKITHLLTNPVTIIGHARLVTNGSLENNMNNQPVIKDDLIAVHNGIIVNDLALWKKFPELIRKSQVDTEIALSLLRKFLKETNSIVQASIATYKLLEGSASIATVFKDFNTLLLATNTGSLYICKSNDNQNLIFASEEFILKKIIKIKTAKKYFNIKKIRQIIPQTGYIINTSTLKTNSFKFNQVSKEIPIQKINSKIVDISSYPPYTQKNFDIQKTTLLSFDREFYKNQNRINNLRRCSRCILPETMPFIKYDNKGVCNYCHNYQKIETKGKNNLEKILSTYKINKNKPNCIVSFSGGRDSSYALHYTKNILKLNPVAYSYDWGMLTDLGRRNQARMCGKLGIEHILVSADITQKRKYIQDNVLAWLKKPDLGMIPLFMAGDKQYFYYLNKLKKDMGIDLVIYGDNALEKTDFKYGFANIELNPEVGKAYNIGKLNSIKLAFYYAKNFISNPNYINSSLIDSFTAYLSSYLVPKDYVYLFRYILWQEKEVSSTLINQYNWETAKDTHTTWRIGDGTASFYNYIYYTMAGLTENDTFYSNMIRENIISRKEALSISAIENLPRWDSIQWYCNTIGIDMQKTIEIINHAPKRYG